MNDIDRIALSIAQHVYGTDPEPGEDMSLYRIYALLVLTVGRGVDCENVHDAWSVWTAGTNPNHKSLIPFDELSPEVRALDEKYRDAIRAVARRM